MKKTTFKTENWNKGTPIKWRNIGDAMLALGSGLGVILASLPLPTNTKVWVVAGVGLLSTIGKFLTKLFSDD